MEGLTNDCYLPKRLLPASWYSIFCCFGWFVGWLEQFGHPFTILGYESCFLPDPTNLEISAIKRYDVGLLKSELRAVRRGRRSSIKPELFRRQEQPLFITTKRKAQLWELNEFLKTVKNVYSKYGLFRNNPQIFISYAWEEGMRTLARQQSHLRQLTHDLTTLGFPSWLDVERMVGNVDEQMAGNIESSSFAIVICTPRYVKRAKEETNVRKEFCKIMQKQLKGEIVVFPVLFLGSPNDAIPEELKNLECVDFRHIDDGDAYIQQLTSMQNGLISRMTQFATMNDNLRSECQQGLVELNQQLDLLPAKHLLVNKG